MAGGYLGELETKCGRMGCVRVWLEDVGAAACHLLLWAHTSPAGSVFQDEFEDLSSTLGFEVRLTGKEGKVASAQGRVGRYFSHPCGSLN